MKKGKLRKAMIVAASAGALLLPVSGFGNVSYEQVPKSVLFGSKAERNVTGELKMTGEQKMTGEKTSLVATAKKKVKKPKTPKKK